MKKIFFFGLFLCFVFCHAQNPFVDINEHTQNQILLDTVTPQPQEVVQAPDAQFISEPYQIPAYGLYNQEWDVHHLRSKQIHIPFNENILQIILVESHNSPFIFPCRGNVILNYGPVRRGGFHPGVDFQLNSEDPVYACFDGVVRMAQSYGDYGNLVVIRHYNGLETVYGHLHKLYVEPNQVIKAGHIIGVAGRTGNANQVMLHFETRFLNEYFNPGFILNMEERTLNSNILTLEPSSFNIVPLPEIRTRFENPVEKEPVMESPANVQETTITEDNISIINENELPVDKNDIDHTHQYHIIQKGETLYRISVKYDTSVEEILRLNNFKNASLIQAGQKIRVK